MAVISFNLTFCFFLFEISSRAIFYECQNLNWVHHSISRPVFPHAYHIWMNDYGMGLHKTSRNLCVCFNILWQNFKFSGEILETGSAIFDSFYEALVKQYIWPAITEKDNAIGQQWKPFITLTLFLNKICNCKPVWIQHDKG